MGLSTVSIPITEKASENRKNAAEFSRKCNFSGVNPNEEFANVFGILLQDICNGNLVDNINDTEFMEEMKGTWEWLRKVMLYNVPQGKQLRGRLVVTAYKGLIPDAPEEMLKLAYILGWCVEILQAAYLVADDIMDSGHLRRGRPCWHRLTNVGITAVNDTFLLEHTAYQIIHKYFKHLPCYTDLLDLCLGITFKTILGQSLDLHSSMKHCETKNNDLFSNYTSELYTSIVHYKTGYYTCYLPIALALSLAGISRKNEVSLWNHVECVALAIGHLFQVQDDFLDCFGLEDIIGKVGSDIQEGKCTWLFVTAKESLAGDGHDNWYEILKDNYGKCDDSKVAIVKKIYGELDLPKKFQDYQVLTHDKISGLIHKINKPGLQKALISFLDSVCKRNH